MSGVQHRFGEKHRPVRFIEDAEDNVMQLDHIPVRTLAGDQEIANRTMKLGWQTRALLVSMNGSKTVADLPPVFKSNDELLAAVGQLQDAGLAIATGTAASIPRVQTDAGLTPLHQARALLNETLVGSLGLMGGISAFRFTLKLERCYTREELLSLFPEYERLVGKAKSPQLAKAVLTHVEALLNIA